VGVLWDRPVVVESMQGCGVCSGLGKFRAHGTRVAGDEAGVAGEGGGVAGWGNDGGGGCTPRAR
jgi:hypothetical protein